MRPTFDVYHQLLTSWVITGRVGEVSGPTKHARASSGQDGLTPICPFVQGQAELHDSDAYHSDRST